MLPSSRDVLTSFRLELRTCHVPKKPNAWQCSMMTENYQNVNGNSKFPCINPSVIISLSLSHSQLLFVLSIVGMQIAAGGGDDSYATANVRRVPLVSTTGFD